MEAFYKCCGCVDDDGFLWMLLIYSGRTFLKQLLVLVTPGIPKFAYMYTTATLKLLWNDAISRNFSASILGTSSLLFPLFYFTFLCNG